MSDNVSRVDWVPLFEAVNDDDAVNEASTVVDALIDGSSVDTADNETEDVTDWDEIELSDTLEDDVVECEGVFDERLDREFCELLDSDGTGVALELISEEDEMYGDRVPKWGVADGHDETLKELCGLCVNDALPETDVTTDSDVRLVALWLASPLTLADDDSVVDTLCDTVFVGVVVVDDVTVPGSTLAEGVVLLVCEPDDVATAVCRAEFVNVYVESGEDE